MPIYSGIHGGAVAPTAIVVRQTKTGIRVYVPSYITPQMLVLLSHNPDMLPPAYLYRKLPHSKSKYVGYLFPSWVQLLNETPESFLENTTDICYMVCVYDIPNTAYMYEFVRIWKSMIIPIKLIFKRKGNALQIKQYDYRICRSAGKYRLGLIHRFMKRYAEYYRYGSLINVVAGGTKSRRKMISMPIIPMCQGRNVLDSKSSEKT